MLNRRQFVGALAGAPAVLRGAAAKPNVLMISVDDWNDWVGALGGHPQVKTPNVDRLASQGVLFTDAHTASPLCNPSRTAILTGRRPTSSGVYDNEQKWRPSMQDAVTIPQHFRSHGYRATGGGKVFHHGKGFNDPGSWDDYFFWNPKARENEWFDNYSFPPDPEPPRPVTPMPTVSWRNFDWAPLDVSDERMPDYLVSSWAAEELGKRHDRPFFLAAGMFRPHIPWFVPRKYFDMYPLESIIVPTLKEDDLADLPPAAWQMALNKESRHDLLVSTGNWKKAVQAYLACITFSDAMVGRMLDALDRGPNRDNTIVVFWSDHGYHLGEKWHWHKQALWQRATHVPFIVRAPGVKPARCRRPVDLMNVYPTLADLSGCESKAKLDGVSVRPLLSDPEAKWERPAISTYLRGNHGAFTEGWHYIRYANGNEELYDRTQDPHEWVNMAARAETERVRREMAAMLPADFRAM
jgi:arylsulfatase A-like enzyme